MRNQIDIGNDVFAPFDYTLTSDNYNSESLKAKKVNSHMELVVVSIEKGEEFRCYDVNGNFSEGTAEETIIFIKRTCDKSLIIKVDEISGTLIENLVEFCSIIPNNKFLGIRTLHEGVLEFSWENSIDGVVDIEQLNNVIIEGK